MRHLIAVAAFAAVVAPVAGQQADGWAKKMFVKDGVLQTDHDFGVVPNGGLLNHRFTITNIYAVPMQVTDVRVSCGCTTCVAPPGTLAPNQSAEIDVTMDTRKINPPGRKTVTIYLSVGPQYVSTAALRVTATTRADVVLNPGSVNFGPVASGQTPEKVIDVEYAGNFAWQVTGFVAPQNAFFDVGSVTPFPTPPGRVGNHVAVRLRPDAPAGMNRQEFHLRTNDPQNPLVPVLVEAVVQPPLKVTPARTVKFERVPVGQSVTQRIFISATQPFMITSVQGQTTELQAAASLQAVRGTHIVNLTYTPQQPGPFKTKLTFVTSLDGQTATVDVEAN